MSMSDGHTNSDEDDFYDEADSYPPSAESETDLATVDVEAYDFECITPDDADNFFATAVKDFMDKSTLQDAYVARMLLHHFQWDCREAAERYLNNPTRTLVRARIRSGTLPPDSSNVQFCETCFDDLDRGESRSLDCGHQFCADCWVAFLEVQIGQVGRSTEITCMYQGCGILAPMEFVLQLIAPQSTRLDTRYLQLCRDDWVRIHPQLRFCPGKNCQAVVKVEQIRAKRVVCSFCHTQFCCQCGGDYHAPATCENFKKWLTKCADDSETTNYILGHTKDCPNCDVCIEKSGGCNHMHCRGCQFHFCWVCLREWDSYTHKCNSYEETPSGANEPNVRCRANEALKRYLFYFTRWDNHAKSLRLEEVMRRGMRRQIEQKVIDHDGTWFDLQYILDAAGLLAKCRYTLQYTYAYAYFMEPGPRKELFEYQQANLETEIEDLSWKLERAETYQRGELMNQMVIAEKRRSILLKDFLTS